MSLGSFSFLLLQLLLCCMLLSQVDCRLSIVYRLNWGARKAKWSTGLAPRLPFVVIHHTAGESCYNRVQCREKVQSIQDYHMDHKGWWDIGYNFLISGDGSIYEGRGWFNLGSHAKGYNSRSLGIAFIGDFTSMRPTEAAISKAKELIAASVRRRRISSRYSLKAHRDISRTSCPGNLLYEMVKKNFAE